MWNYISIRPTEIKSRIVLDEHYWWSTKLNGHYIRIVVNDEGIKTYSKAGIAINLQHIKFNVPNFKGELFGELITSNGRSTHSEVTKCLANDSDCLQIIVFGACVGHKNLTVAEFNEICIIGEGINKIKWNRVQSRGEIDEAFKSIIVDSGEGIVVVTDAGFVYKIKEEIELDLVILGYSLGLGGAGGSIRDLLYGVLVREGEFCILGRTSQGLNPGNSESLLSHLSSFATSSNYIEVSSAKTAFVFVEPRFVGEFKCLDIQGANSLGLIRKPVLRFSKQLGYSYIQEIHSVAFHSLVFKHLRLDKFVSEENAGLQQLQSFIDPEIIEVPVDLVDSVVELREVYSKESKNGLAIRKILVIKTKKENRGDFSQYYSFYTDYSPGRKSPLENEIYLHATLTEATEKFNILKEKNILKGWVKVN